MSNNPVPPSVNIQNLLTKGEEIYQQIKANLEPNNIGQYVAIEVDSQRHFVGLTKDEAVAQAKTVFPDKIFFVRRIGEIEKIAVYSSIFSPTENYDWLF